MIWQEIKQNNKNSNNKVDKLGLFRTLSRFIPWRTGRSRTVLPLVVLILVVTTVFVIVPHWPVTRLRRHVHLKDMKMPRYGAFLPNSSAATSVSTADGTMSRARVTIVTAYFDLGTFRKGSWYTHFKTSTYENWAVTFAYLLNPLVVYTDSAAFESLMRNIRHGLATEFVRITRNSSWAFENNEQIARIFSDKLYPKYHPITVSSEYDCAQHAKFDVMARATRKNYFHTDYFAWLDIGYFRGTVSDRTYFKLQLPPGFNSSRLSVNLVHNVSTATTPAEIFKGDNNWVGGGLFVGTANVIQRFERQFRRTVDYFLAQDLASAEQQVLYAMYSDEGRKYLNEEISLQIYKSPYLHGWFFKSEIHHDWFYLGYLMRLDIHM